MLLPDCASAQPQLQVNRLPAFGGRTLTRGGVETTMDIKLTGRKALITGGSKGLGLAIARTFAEAGADVAIMARRQGPLEEAVAAIGAQTGQVLPVACDVRRAEDIAAGFARVAQAFGQ